MRVTQTLAEDSAEKLPRFQVHPKHGGFCDDLDLLKLNQLNDELEIESFHEKLRRNMRD